MLKLKLQYFGHLMQRADSLEKTLMLGKIEGSRRRGQEGWMASPAQCTLRLKTGKPDVLWSMGLQIVIHDWVTEKQENTLGFPGGASGKELTCQCRRLRDTGSIPGLGRSPGEGQGNPLQYSCLENPMDRGAWWATVHGAAKSQTQLKQLSMYNTG